MVRIKQEFEVINVENVRGEHLWIHSRLHPPHFRMSEKTTKKLEKFLLKKHREVGWFKLYIELGHTDSESLVTAIFYDHNGYLIREKKTKVHMYIDWNTVLVKSLELIDRDELDIPPVKTVGSKVSVTIGK